MGGEAWKHACALSDKCNGFVDAESSTFVAPRQKLNTRTYLQHTNVQWVGFLFARHVDFPTVGQISKGKFLIFWRIGLWNESLSQLTLRRRRHFPRLARALAQKTSRTCPLSDRASIVRAREDDDANAMATVRGSKSWWASACALPVTFKLPAKLQGKWAGGRMAVDKISWCE